MGKRDIAAAVHLITGQVVELEQVYLDLMARHTAALEHDDPADAQRLADEYEACYELRQQYIEILRRAS